MNIILGASGQVGSAIFDNLIKNNKPVRAVIRNDEKEDDLKRKGAEVSVADLFDLEALKIAVKGGKLIFVLTPETGKSNDVLGDTKTILENYRKAIESSAVKKVIGLSSIGAQHESGTGNLLMSYMLEHAFTDMLIHTIFVRPSYYYSNWLFYLSSAQEHGILPTFFPVDLKIPMNSPIDVAAFIADKIINGNQESAVYQLEGPEAYSSNEVANAFGKVLDRQVKAQQIPRENWEETLQKAGFTKDAIEKFIAMTEAVIDGKTRIENKGTNPVQLKTTLIQYLEENLK